MKDQLERQYLTVNSRIRVPISEMRFSFARSSGPGGQNVNKVNSKAVLRWNVSKSASLPNDVRDRFLAKYQSRLTTGGQVVLSSERFRDQPKNVADCLDRLRDWIAAVATAPKPRRPSRPTRGSRERRLKTKHRNSETKRGRQGADWES